MISLQSKGLSRVFFNTTVQKQQFFGAQPSLRFNSHLYMTTRKTIDLTRQSFAGKVMSLLFNVLSRLVIAFLPSSKCLLIFYLLVISNSVQFSCSVMSYSLRPHGLQRAWFPCPSPNTQSLLKLMSTESVM